MGTRHLICVIQNKKMMVAQYGQWDGYPSGQGADVINFIRLANLDKFRKQVAKVKHLTDKEVEAKFETGKNLVDLLDKPESTDHLSRDCCAKILNYIQTAKAPEVYLSTDFAGDSLFCEWVWLINLDTDKLEVYQGFNKQPLHKKTERFLYLQPNDAADALNLGQYFPVRLWKKIRFDKLTAKTAEKLQQECDGEK